MLSWKVGNVACKFMHYLLNVTVYVTIYTLVCIAAVRHATVVYNKQTTWLRTRRNITAACLGLWAFFAVVNLPIAFQYGVFEHKSTGRMECALIDLDAGRTIFATFFVFAYVVPLLSIGLLSASMLYYIRGRRRRHVNIRTSGSNSSSTGGGSGDVTAKRASRRTRHVTRLVVAIVVVFAALWLPVHVHLLLFYTDKLNNVNWVYEAVSALWNVLAYVNSCINPVVYTIASSEFRSSFTDVLCCRCCCGKKRRRAPVNSSEDTRRSSAPPRDDCPRDHDGQQCRLVALGNDIGVEGDNGMIMDIR